MVPDTLVGELIEAGAPVGVLPPEEAKDRPITGPVPEDE